MARGRDEVDPTDEPDAQRRRAPDPEPRDLMCSITWEMFRDPVILVESGETYERAAIEEHLSRRNTDPTDPNSNVPLRSTLIVPNHAIRRNVETWLSNNPDRTPGGWDSREMRPLTRSSPRTRRAPRISYYQPDVAVLQSWRDACPELELLWPPDVGPGSWDGVGWHDGRVKQVVLCSERLSGEIPKELGQLTSLEHLQLNYNQLSGEIPKELGNIQHGNNLEGRKAVLDLHNNKLSGEIPKELGQLTSLNELDLSNNQLSGVIPTALGLGTRLVELRLNHNKLSGEIPKEMGLNTWLYQLKLDENQLSGEIPKELGQLTFLQVLYLDNNRLSGEIPKELGQIGYLVCVPLR